MKKLQRYILDQGGDIQSYNLMWHDRMGSLQIKDAIRDAKMLDVTWAAFTNTDCDCELHSSILSMPTELAYAMAFLFEGQINSSKKEREHHSHLNMFNPGKN